MIQWWYLIDAFNHSIDNDSWISGFQLLKRLQCPTFPNKTGFLWVSQVEISSPKPPNHNRPNDRQIFLRSVLPWRRGLVWWGVNWTKTVPSFYRKNMGHVVYPDLVKCMYILIVIYLLQPSTTPNCWIWNLFLFCDISSLSFHWYLCIEAAAFQSFLVRI